ncbi:ricin B lectin domain-containing protein [Kockovaella imperatae]|uniref:Ricin B lectin domain-containing protein n=1 Tax=Kockovaella imperatae TaxID=4999 RepID=A0A1Y1UN38_9TREE|nr:ricin B lectin domain-containing protein [Kockovaella imperatae]ORX38866.1 ricin B lectin domain-containing protein [Kockovaella imperatae]
MHASATAALFALLASSAFATPIQKRYSGVTIRSYRTGTCLNLQAGVTIQNGSPVWVGDCSTATLWDINPGSGSVLVHGTNFALDAGENPHNFVPAKVWQSYPGLTQQTWYLTPDNRIAITGGTMCLDEGDNGPQTYQCTTGDTNQIWYVDQPATSTSMAASTSSMAPSSTSSAAPSASASSGPTGPSTTISWNGNTGMCATVQGSFANGTPVNLAPCTKAANQMFYAFDGGAIQLAGTNYCLDAGSNPADGTQMKIWQCYFGLSQQVWNFNGNLISTANSESIFNEIET